MNDAAWPATGSESEWQQVPGHLAEPLGEHYMQGGMETNFSPACAIPVMILSGPTSSDMPENSSAPVESIPSADSRKRKGKAERQRARKQQMMTQETQSDWHGHHIDQMLMQNDKFLKEVQSSRLALMTVVLVVVLVVMLAFGQAMWSNHTWQVLLKGKDGTIKDLTETNELLKKNQTEQQALLQEKDGTIQKMKEGDAKQQELLQEKNGAIKDLTETNELLKKNQTEQQALLQEKDGTIQKLKETHAKQQEEKEALQKGFNETIELLTEELMMKTFELKMAEKNSGKLDDLRLSYDILQKSVTSELASRAEENDRAIKKLREVEKRLTNTLHHGLHWMWRFQNSEKNAEDLKKRVEEIMKDVDLLMKELEKANDFPGKSAIMLLVGLFAKPSQQSKF